MEREHVSDGVSLRRWAGVAALAVLSLIAVEANAKAGREFDAFMAMATGAAKQTVTFGSNGTPITTTGVPGPTKAGSMNFSHSGGQWPTASGTARVPSPLGAGKELPVTAKQAFTKPSAAKALVNFAKKAGPIGQGMAIYELLSELGVLTNHNSATGENEFRGDSATMAWSYSFTGNCADLSGAGYPTVQSACSAVGAAGIQCGNRNNPGTSFTLLATGLQAVTATSAQCRYDYRDNNTMQTGTSGWIVMSGAPVATNEPMTAEAVEQRIASESGWPTTSAIDRALADAVNSGETLTPDGPLTLTPQVQKVEGPTKTTTRSDGSSTTEKTECTWVQPLTGTIEFRCGVQTTDTVVIPHTVTSTNPDGSTSTTTTTTTKTVTAMSERSDGATPDDKKPEFDVPDGEIPRRDVVVTYTPENLGFGSGSCPAPLSMATSNGTYAVNLTPYCSMISTIVKPLVLAFATLAAFFIIGGFRTGE